MDTSLYDLQDELIEHKIDPYSKRFAFVSYYIEAAGDIYRELFKYNNDPMQADEGYINGKILRLKSFQRNAIGEERELREARRKYPDIARAYDVYAEVFLHNLSQLETATAFKFLTIPGQALDVALAAIAVIRAFVQWGRQRPDYGWGKSWYVIRKIEDLENELSEFWEWRKRQ